MPHNIMSQTRKVCYILLQNVEIFHCFFFFIIVSKNIYCRLYNNIIRCCSKNECVLVNVKTYIRE